MNLVIRRFAIFRLAIITALSLSWAMPLQAAEIKVLSAGAYEEVITSLLPEFQKQTGDHVIVETATAGVLLKRIQGGEKFDLVIASDSVLDTLTTAGKTVAGSRKNIAQVGIGVCVKAGAASPDISTVEAFKATLLAAKSIAYIDPASGGSSGIYFDQLITRLGIAGQVRPKAKLKQGGRVADLVAGGEAELGIHQISEILPVSGVTLVGPLPKEIQNLTTYAAGVSAQSESLAATQALLQWLSGPTAAGVLQKKGMTAIR